MSNLFSVLSLAVGALGICLGFYYFRQSRIRKTLDWKPLSNTPLLAKAAAGELPDLDVVYDGQSVRQPRIVRMRLQNTGNREVPADDFVVFPTFTFNKARLLAAFVVDESSLDVYGVSEFLFEPGAQGVQLDPEVLNPGDWVDLQFVIDGESEWPVVSCRFAGQTRPLGNVRSSRIRRSRIVGWILLGASAATVLVSAGIVIGTSVAFSDLAALTIVLSMALGIGTGLLSGARREESQGS